MLSPPSDCVVSIVFNVLGGSLVITILPEEPRVVEGDTAQLVCIATGMWYMVDTD